MNVPNEQLNNPDEGSFGEDTKPRCLHPIPATNPCVTDRQNAAENPLAYISGEVPEESKDPPEFSLIPSRETLEAKIKEAWEELNRMRPPSRKVVFDLGGNLDFLKTSMVRGNWEKYVEDDLGIQLQIADLCLEFFGLVSEEGQVLYELDELMNGWST